MMTIPKFNPNREKKMENIKKSPKKIFFVWQTGENRGKQGKLFFTKRGIITPGFERSLRRNVK